MRNRDAQVRDLFIHVRQAVELLEEIILRPLSSPEVLQKLIVPVQRTTVIEFK